MWRGDGEPQAGPPLHSLSDGSWGTHGEGRLCVRGWGL